MYCVAIVQPAGLLAYDESDRKLFLDMKCMCWNLWRGLAAWHLRFIVLNGGREEGVSGGRHITPPCRYARVTQCISFRIMALFCKNEGRLRFGSHERTLRVYCWKVGSRWVMVINSMWPGICAEWERYVLWPILNATAKISSWGECNTADSTMVATWLLWRWVCHCGCSWHTVFKPHLFPRHLH